MSPSVVSFVPIEDIFCHLAISKVTLSSQLNPMQLTRLIRLGGKNLRTVFCIDASGNGSISAIGAPCSNRRGGQMRPKVAPGSEVLASN